MSWKTAVKVKGEEGWSYNALRFATSQEADSYGADLSRRWLLVEKWEAQESDEPVNYHFSDGELQPIGTNP